MDNRSENKTHFRLKAIYISIIAIAFIAAFLSYVYITKYDINIPCITLERYAIMLTLIGIPCTLKFLHDKIKALDGKNQKKYQQLYILRLSILAVICFFNLISFYFTGTKNFFFMAMISIFAMLLCPLQKEDKEQTDSDNNLNE